MAVANALPRGGERLLSFRAGTSLLPKKGWVNAQRVNESTSCSWGEGSGLGRGWGPGWAGEGRDSEARSQGPPTGTAG